MSEAWLEEGEAWHDTSRAGPSMRACPGTENNNTDRFVCVFLESASPRSRCPRRASTGGSAVTPRVCCM